MLRVRKESENDVACVGRAVVFKVLRDRARRADRLHARLRSESVWKGCLSSIPGDGEWAGRQVVQAHGKRGVRLRDNAAGQRSGNRGDSYYLTMETTPL